MDIRLKTEKYTIGDKEYELCCNMNVLAEAQDRNNGSLVSLLNERGSLTAGLIFGAAMLNECADINGWEERFTDRTLGRLIPTLEELISFSMLVMGVVTSAVGTLKNGNKSEENSEKNDEPAGE